MIATIMMMAEMEPVRMKTNRRVLFELSPLQSLTFMPNRDVKKESGSFVGKTSVWTQIGVCSVGDSQKRL